MFNRRAMLVLFAVVISVVFFVKSGMPERKISTNWDSNPNMLLDEYLEHIKNAQNIAPERMYTTTLVLYTENQYDLKLSSLRKDPEKEELKTKRKEFKTLLDIAGRSFEIHVIRNQEGLVAVQTYLNDWLIDKNSIVFIKDRNGKVYPLQGKKRDMGGIEDISQLKFSSVGSYTSLEPVPDGDYTFYCYNFWSNNIYENQIAFEFTLTPGPIMDTGIPTEKDGETWLFVLNL